MGDTPLPSAPSSSQSGWHSLFFPFVCILTMGFIFIYSSSSINANNVYHNEFHYLSKQLVYFVLGLAIATPFAFIPVESLFRHRYLILGGCLIFGLLTLVPGVGRRINGARRWVQILGIQFQPAEILKFATIIVASYELSQKTKSLKLGLSILIALITLLLQPDFGNFLILGVTLFGLFILAGLSHRIIAFVPIIVLPALALLTLIAPYRMRRVTAFLDPYSDPLGSGFQIIQSFLAISTGGLLGKGLGNSEQKLYYLPEAHTDFIFSVIAEEMGFIGVALVIFFFFILFFSMVNTALHAPNHATRLLTWGFALHFILGALINLAMVAGLLPTKGLPLPLISSGGTHLIVTLVSFAIILNIKKNSGIIEK